MIDKDMILSDVDATSWREACRMAGSLLVKGQYAKEEYVESMVKTVENLGPYMILVPKVAFFHGPPSDAVIKPGLSLVVLKDAVFFEEFENQEIRCAFAFCATDNHSHLELLQQLAGLLGNGELIEALTSNGSKERILELMEA